jgi:hypothetical protein
VLVRARISEKGGETWRGEGGREGGKEGGREGEGREGGMCMFVWSVRVDSKSQRVWWCVYIHTKSVVVCTYTHTMVCGVCIYTRTCVSVMVYVCARRVTADVFS